MSISSFVSDLPHGRRLGRAIRHRWLALAVATVAAVVPLSVGFALVQIQDFGPSRFTSNGNCDLPTSGDCPAITAIGNVDNSAIRAVGAVKVDGTNAGFVAPVAVDATNNADTGRGVFAHSAKFIGVQGDGGQIGVVANGTGTSGTGLQAKGAALGVFAKSDAGEAVHATTTTGTSVDANANGSGTAVKATSASGTAVSAQANTTAGTFAAGVFASGDEAVVARGTSLGLDVTATSTAVGAVSSNGIGGSFAGKQAPIRLFPAATVGAPQSGTHVRGELYVDSQGQLFLCVADSTGGNPGTWKHVHLDN